MIDPKTTHAIDQLTAYFGTLGSGYAVFIREAMASGATPEQALEGGKAALHSWMTRPLSPPEGE